MSLRPPAIAVAAALVLAGGVVAVAHNSDSKPTAVRRPVLIGLRPSAAPSHRSPSPRPSPSPARPPTPAKPVASRPLYPLPAKPAYPRPCPPPPIPPGPPFHPPKPRIKTDALPAALPAVAHRKVSLAPIAGKGMWLTTWPDTRVNAAAVVAKAKAAGLTQLWLRSGGSPLGWYGHTVLDALLPAAHLAGLRVVAWDFPTLSDPMRDARRAERTLLTSYGGQHIDAFSADIETIYEGTFNAPRRVQVYLSRVQHAAGTIPVIATVLRPTPYMLQTYPYRAEAPYVDAFAPMVYWSCTEPGVAAAESIRPLAKLRPVHLIGQSYNMGPEGGRHGLPTGREIWRFLDVAKRAGAVGASLYDYSETRGPQWRALTDYPWSGRDAGQSKPAS